MADETKAGNGRPKLSQLLLDLKADLLRGRIEDDFVFAQRRFRMHTLTDGEALWRDKFVSMASNMALMSSRMSATVAASISHINDVPIHDLFEMPDDPKLVGFLKNSLEDREDFYRERMFEFMAQFDDNIVAEFHKFYTGLEGRRDEVIGQLKNSSKETSTSTSSSSSSPADGLPAAAPPETRGSSFGT